MGIISVTTIARWPKAWRVDQPVDECVYVREGRPRDPLNHKIALLANGAVNDPRWSRIFFEHTSFLRRG